MQKISDSNCTSRLYCVAGHLFRIRLPEDSLFWNRLGQYDPFEVKPEPAVDPVAETPGHKVLFEFELTDGMPQVEKKPFHISEPQDGFTTINLYETESGWLFEFTMPSGHYAEMLASYNFSHARFCPHTTNSLAVVPLMNNALMLLYSFASCPYNTLEIHASVVSNTGQAYLFLGESGAGKSTHSRQWLENIPDSELMNDDNPVVRILDDGTVMAYGSPWSGKTPCYRNVSAPAGAFVSIRQCKENKATAMNLFEAYATLYSSSSGLKGNTRFADLIHPTLERIATTVPFIYLDCRPDKEAAEVCRKAVCR